MIPSSDLTAVIKNIFWQGNTLNLVLKVLQKKMQNATERYKKMMFFKVFGQV